MGICGLNIERSNVEIKMIEKIKAKKKVIIFLLVFGIFGVPVLIHILFKIDIGIDWIEAEWTAGEFLAYYGNILSFLGTIVLSSLALWQNHEIKTESDRYTQYLERLEINKNMARFMSEKIMSEKNNKNLELGLMNISDNIAYDVTVSNFQLYANHILIWEKNDYLKFTAIKPNENKVISLNNPEILEKHILKFELTSYDKFLKKHYYSGIAKYIEKSLIVVIEEQMREEQIEI